MSQKKDNEILNTIRAGFLYGLVKSTENSKGKEITVCLGDRDDLIGPGVIDEYLYELKGKKIIKSFNLFTKKRDYLPPKKPSNLEINYDPDCYKEYLQSKEHYDDDYKMRCDEIYCAKIQKVDLDISALKSELGKLNYSQPDLHQKISFCKTDYLFNKDNLTGELKITGIESIYFQDKRAVIINYFFERGKTNRDFYDFNNFNDYIEHGSIKIKNYYDQQNNKLNKKYTDSQNFRVDIGGINDRIKKTTDNKYEGIIELKEKISGYPKEINSYRYNLMIRGIKR